MVAALQQLPACLLQAAGGRGLLAVAGSRLIYSAACSIGSSGEDGKRAHHGVPASLPEVPRRPAPPPQQQLSLASINDPETWGLAGSPAPQDHQEAAGYFWLGNSCSNPKEAPAHLSSPPRGASPSASAPQAFRTAAARPAAQRSIAFRSSMVEPELPLSFRSSMVEPELPLSFRSSMTDPPLRS